MAKKNTVLNNLPEEEILWADTKRWVGLPWTFTKYILTKEKLLVETDTFYDILVNWHLQKIVLPTIVPEEEENPFNPYNKDYIDGKVDLEGNPIVEPTEYEDPTEAVESTEDE